MAKRKKRRRGAVADPEIQRQASKVAGVLAEIFEVDKQQLLDRPRPSGELRNVRDIMFGVLHLRMGISQQKIAAALGRDRGVVSDAAHAISEASEGDVNVRFALVEITEQVANVLTQAEAWREALRQEALARAMQGAIDERAAEAIEDEELERALREDIAPAPKPMRCHQCKGEGKIRVHSLGSDPAYRHAWAEAERAFPSRDGFHSLDCRFCNGTGKRALKPAAGAALPKLAAAGE